MASKRRRDVGTPDTQLIEIYEDLANENEEIRLRAAHTLLSKFSVPSSSSPQKLRTIVQRLFRGLCSSRKAVRLGFSVALTEFLAQIFQYPVEETGLSHKDILEILDKQTVADGSTSGQDERDHYFGRLFGAEAIVKSSILFKGQPSLQLWRGLLQFICDLALKKQWLRQECGWLAFSSISYIRAANLEPEFALTIIEALKSNNLVRTPEGVAVWLEVKSCYPDAALPENVWKHRDPLCKDEATSLAEVMRDASGKQQPSCDDSTASQGAGTWSQQLHFAWDVVLRELYSAIDGEGKGSSKRIKFLKFWTDVVDKSLFLPSSSPERKHWGFLLLTKVQSTAPIELLGAVFTQNTILCLVHHLKVDDRYLHRSAKKAVQALQTRAISEPKIVSHVIQGLVLGPSGQYNFDNATKTKTIGNLIKAAEPKSLLDLLPALCRAMEQPQENDEKRADAKRRAFADILVSITTHVLAGIDQETDPSISLVKKILDALLAPAYSNKSPGPDGITFEPQVSLECRTYLRSRIRTCLELILQHSSIRSNLFRHTIETLRDIQKQAGSGNLMVEFDEQIQQIVDEAWSNMKRISKAGSRKKSASIPTKSAEVLEMFYGLAMLQLYDEDADAPGILQDLNDYQQSLTSPSKLSEGRQSEESEPVVEIVLSFASKLPRFYHQAALQAFRAFASEIGRTGIRSLIRVLMTKESATGKQDLFDVDENIDHPMEDVESNQQNGHLSDSDTSESDMVDSDVEELSVESSSLDEEDEESENDQAELEAFEAKLAAALGTRRGQADLDAEDTEGSDEDMYEEEMDEKEMEALDDKIAEVFRARKPAANKKQERKDMKEAIINFKRRVLDLVDVYLKQETLNPLGLDLVLPLIKTARTTSVKQVAERAHSVLDGFCSKCKGTEVPAIDDQDHTASDILGSLRAIHEEAGLDNSRAHARACSRASILFAKVLVRAKADVGKVVDVYAETRKKQLLDKGCKVQPTFFTDWNNWCTSARDQLAA